MRFPYFICRSILLPTEDPVRSIFKFRWDVGMQFNHKLICVGQQQQQQVSTLSVKQESTNMGQKRSNGKVAVKSSSSGTMPDYAKLRPNDIPCGRDCGNYRKGPGCEEFRRLIMETAEEYGAKQSVCSEILKNLENKNIRFVSWASAKKCWKKTESKTVIQKIFRACQHVAGRRKTTQPSRAAVRVLAAGATGRRETTRPLRNAAMAAAAGIADGATGRAKIFGTIPSRVSNSAFTMMVKGTNTDKHKISDFVTLAAVVVTGGKIKSVKVVILIPSAPLPPFDTPKPTTTTVHQDNEIKTITKPKTTESQNPVYPTAWNKRQLDHAVPEPVAKKPKATVPSNVASTETAVMTGDRVQMTNERQAFGHGRVVSVEKICPIDLDLTLEQTVCDSGTRQPQDDNHDEFLVDLMELDFPWLMDVQDQMEESHSMEPIVHTSRVHLDALHLLPGDDSTGFLKSSEEDGIPLIPLPKNFVFCDSCSSVWDNEVSP